MPAQKEGGTGQAAQALGNLLGALQEEGHDKKMAAKEEARQKKAKKLEEAKQEGTATEADPVAKPRRGRPPGGGGKSLRPPTTPRPQQKEPEGKTVTPGKRKGESQGEKAVTPAPGEKAVTPAPKKAKPEGSHRLSRSLDLLCVGF